MLYENKILSVILENKGGWRKLFLSLHVKR